MKITKEKLLQIIQEEISGVTEADMLDPSAPLEMSKDMELFLDEVLDASGKELGIIGDDEASDELYSLLLTQMAAGSQLSKFVAEELADLYRSGFRGREPSPLDYEE